MPPRPGAWWVYVLELENGAWYTGISTDPRARFEKHKSGQGARSMSLSAPKNLVSLEFIGAYALALRRESQVKKLSRADKELYVKDPGGLAPPQGAWRTKRTKKKKDRA